MTYTKVASHEAKDMTKINKVVLLYSGGLDTSCILSWMTKEYDIEVIALTINVGQNVESIAPLEKRALASGAAKFVVYDAKEEFANDYLAKIIKANGSYQGDYHLGTISRYLFAKIAVDIAQQEGAQAIAHGCTGKGNDQVRFESSIISLAPEIKVIAPVRELAMQRPWQKEYTDKEGIAINLEQEHLYSYDENMWYSSAEGAEIDDPKKMPIFKKILKMTTTPQQAELQEEEVEIGFKEGLPVTWNGKELSLVDIIVLANALGAKHGLGVQVHIEDRLVGLKIRDVYEQPGASLLIAAHKELEKLVCTREENKFKQIVDQEWAYLVYGSAWHSPLRKDLDAFINNVNKKVTGWVKLSVYKGNIVPIALHSQHSLLDPDLNTWEKDTVFEENSAAGFIELHSLSQKMANKVQNKG